MSKKKALVTGITGQCGSYLAEYLLQKDYEVHGLDRRKSVDNHQNIAGIKAKIKLIEGDITDGFSVLSIVDKGKYDEIYNLCAQSHVHTSFEQPLLTYQVNTVGVLNLLEAIRKSSSHSKFYQASTSEMFGSSLPPQSEETVLHPRSPYGVSKLASHWLVQNYHESYKLWVACGIMFNTESSRRGDNFVTKKITNWVQNYTDAYATEGSWTPLELGNLDAKRDWSHALDSVDAIYRICNQDLFYNGIHGGEWRSYCFGSAKAYTVREFLLRSLQLVFNLEDVSERFEFMNSGMDEVLWDYVENIPCVVVSPKYFRPCEVEYLQCDPTRIKNELGWKPKHDLDDIIKEMMQDTLKMYNPGCLVPPVPVTDVSWEK